MQKTAELVLDTEILEVPADNEIIEIPGTALDHVGGGLVGLQL